LLGGSVAAASVAVTYAALGDKLGLLDAVTTGREGQDTDAIRKESVRVNHLLRRAGFGVSREEHDHYQSIGLKATIDELVNYTQIDDSRALELAAEVPIDYPNRQNLPLWWTVRMANTRRPLQEKMTLFWHGLLTSQLSVVRDPNLMVGQNEFLRGNAMSRFPEILRGISRDRAMMIYLDISGSRRGAPNENYARELMELFALGIGNYSEEDVREASRAFTGWQVPRQRDAPGIAYGDAVFNDDRFDGGPKTVLGKTGNFYPDDIVDIIVEQPASAEFIVGKLFAFFVYPNADAKVLRPFVETYRESDMSIGATVEAILRSDVMYSPQAYRSLVRSPTEYGVAAIKALGRQETIGQAFGQGRNQAAARMGQTLFEPPNVAGWPGGATWLNSATMFARLNFINQATGGVAADDRQERAQRREQQALAGDLGTVAQALDHYLPIACDDNLPDEARQILVDFGGGADAALTPDKLRGLVYLILGSPQFQLA
jgi:uncharacterized protein (DUF1800 family)